MNYVIVDTDVVSYLFKRDSRAERYRRYLEGKTIALSFMTVGELFFWAYSKNWGQRSITRLEEHLRNFVVLPFDYEVCRLWARVQAERSARGRPMATADAWVAACALRHGCPLITNNCADFQEIAGRRVISEAV